MFLVTLLCMVLKTVSAWHDFTNVDYHCWSLEASSKNPTPYSSCPGIDIDWLTAPPDRIKAQTPFNVSYSLHFSPAFYSWAVKEKFFTFTNGSDIVNCSKDARTWCETTECPPADKATRDNCCIHHVNIHSCPLEGRTQVPNGLCGPWIKPDGDTYSHSNVLVGSAAQENWTSTVDGLIAVDNLETRTSMIAHFKIAGMQVALNWVATAIPRAICGNSVCEKEEGECCSTCPADCGVCPLKDYVIALIALSGFIVVVAMVSTVLTFAYRNYKLLWDENWVIPEKDLHPDTYVRGFMGSVVSIVTTNSSSREDGQNVNKSSMRQRFTEIAHWKGRVVAVKKIEKIQFTLTKQVRKEVKEMREIDHPNLCKFIGGGITVPNVFIVTEYCPKGALNDVLHNDEVPLNWGFRFSFCTDIAQGMTYLHQRRIVHGNLKSSNCLVDDRWTIKVTDFGLKTYRRPVSDMLENDCPKYDGNKVYRPPEMANSDMLTAEGDVYAFGVILLEIATRNDAYQGEDPSSFQDDWLPELPNLDTEEKNDRCPSAEQYIQLIKSCWCHQANMRPNFVKIKRTLVSINPQKLSPVDMMMNMMEKYSKHLETLVSERTRDLELEKQRTDNLLYRMLPKAVAEELRLGRSVQPKWFNSCTIYFSDIVGFTNLSSSSTPLQVVALLNTLYICFDNIIDKFDVYKVETIGDAYMVVSGVPVENGMAHVTEIANMSLEILDACKTFYIPHIPTELLKIRIGLHTGSVCAGVVGLKMPRYCLFGDTVNTASRMESTGAAGKIHISSKTHEVLYASGGYEFECRGAVAVKGKGDLTTFWLLGKDTLSTSLGDFRET